MCDKCRFYPLEYKRAETYDAAYRIIREKELGVRQGLEQIRDLSEKADLGEEDIYRTYSIDTDTRLESSRESEWAFADTCIRKLCRQAAIMFAPGDTPLDIKPEHYLEQVLGIRPRELEEPVDLLAFWHQLVEKYAESGREQGFQEAAEALIRAFWIRPDKKITYRGRFPVMELHFYAEHDYCDTSIRRAGSRYRDINEALEALKVLCIWAGEPFEAKTWDYRDRVTSRERFKVNDNLDYTTYYEKIEFRFSPWLMEQLQVFLGTFAAETLAQRAA